MTFMLVYCDDPSHTAAALGPLITDPDLALPKGVSIADQFRHAEPVDPDDPRWYGRDDPTGPAPVAYPKNRT